MEGCLQVENCESSKQKTVPKVHLSEPFLISYFLFSLFITYLLTLLLIGRRDFACEVLRLLRHLNLDANVPYQILFCILPNA